MGNVDTPPCQSYWDTSLSDYIITRIFNLTEKPLVTPSIVLEGPLLLQEVFFCECLIRNQPGRVKKEGDSPSGKLRRPDHIGNCTGQNLETGHVEDPLSNNQNLTLHVWDIPGPDPWRFTCPCRNAGFSSGLNVSAFVVRARITVAWTAGFL